ncbi:MAG: glycoside hydrolase family 130 protein [Acidimicrobiales bacterium]
MSQLFVAGEEVTSGPSRASTVIRRVLDLTEAEVDAELAGVLRRFQSRHERLASELIVHFNQISEHAEDARDLSVARRMLLGAYATSEYAVESVSLCNPSIVAHPDQTGVAPGHLRFVLSLRAIGEGHVSSIEFRTGLLDAAGGIDVEDPGPFAVVGGVEPGPYDREAFVALLDRPGSDLEVASVVLGRLPPSFTRAQLEAAIAGVRSRALMRGSGREMVERIRLVADSNYTVRFPEGSRLAQRVLRPGGPVESRGMEDARFVRFVDDDSSVTYYGTYTAFDGARVSPQLLATDDFRTFTVSQLTGAAATNKGMALFPRRIDGRYVALSRWDRESNAVTTSADAREWDDGVEVQHPNRPWELVQVGNCGSPMETPEGWLVITHGVGPMRMYCLGAMLLDLEDPRVVRGQLAVPLLEPEGTERDGYVPNVVYSCGAIVHGGSVVLPYAHGDRETTFARVSTSKLLAVLLAA